MKNAKKILLALLALTLIFALFACGECKHKDEDDDGICDECEEVLEVKTKDVSLIEGGTANFQLVLGSDVGSETNKAVETLIKNLKKLDVEVKKTPENADEVQDVEVLIGTVKTRGEQYLFDKYSLGSKGYVIKIVDSKILITAGSDRQLASAVEEFGDEILGLADDPDELVDVVMTAKQQVEKTQSDYKVTALKINGVDMRGYTIAVDTSVLYHNAAAKFMQNLIYERTGYWFEIVTLDRADKSIIFKGVEKSETVSGGFKISANDKNQLIIECAYDNMLERAVSDFVTARITSASGEVDLNSEFTKDISTLCYEDFGAMGDGRTNDFEAIFNTHLLANECGQRVVATAGKTYYIESPIVRGSVVTISIKTDTDWRGAKFIIDDRTIALDSDTESWGKSNVFLVESDYPSVSITDSKILSAILGTGLNEDTKKLDLKEALGADYAANPYPVMITLYNSTHKIYRRKGYAGYSGSSMKEIAVLDKDGNIDPETYLMWDYTKLTSITVRRCDDKQITVKNGDFTTRAAQYNCVYTKADGSRDAKEEYLSRGMQISRSNALIQNVNHYVTDEVPFSQQIDQATGRVLYVGLPYYGFYRIGSCTDVTIEDCVITGRRCYIRPNGGTSGTYDLSVASSNRTVFKNCTQSNFWVTVDDKGNIKPAKEGDPGAMLGMSTFSFIRKVELDNGTVQGTSMHWGCGGSNFAKNMTFLGSTLSRYDAHDGMYNGKVIDSTVQTIALTGAGEMIIENTKIFPDDGAPRVYGVRNDYGCVFDGVVKMNDVSVIAPMKTSDGASQNLFIVEYDRYTNWYYGYYSVAPSMEINDVTFYDVDKYDESDNTYEAVTGKNVYLYGKTIIKTNSTFHLPEHRESSTYYPWYSVEDKDSDGYIDVPDYDGDGEWGNTEWKYADKKAELGSNYDTGFQDKTSRINFNKVTPPEYVKILGNKSGYTYLVRDTGLSADDPETRTSNGLYHGVAENWKGFFGSTKFYYGTGENDYYQGPPKASEKNPNENLYSFIPNP